MMPSWRAFKNPNPWSLQLPVSSFSMILLWLIFYIKAAPGYNLLSYPMSYWSALRAVDLCHHVLGISSLPCSNVCISNYKVVVTVQLCLILKIFVVAGFLFNHSLAILTLKIKLCADCFLTTASSTSNSKDSQREVRQRSGVWVHCNQGTIPFFLGCLKFLHTWR
jgi:hypothetical protein